MKNKINWKVLIVSLVIVYAVAFVGGLFTSSTTKSGWYEAIKPAITPPNFVFPIVWNILFFLIGVSLYFSWISKKPRETNKVIIAYGLNFLLNILWSILYFGMRNPRFAFFEILLLWGSILYLVMFTYKINKKASYLLIPYLLWVSFATILNYLSI